MDNKKNTFNIKFDADETFNSSIKDGSMDISGNIGDKNLENFVSNNLSKILDSIPDKMLDKVASYVNRRQNGEAIRKKLSEVFNEEQIKFIEFSLKGNSESIEDMRFDKPTKSIGCYVFSKDKKPNIVSSHYGYYDAELDAFLFHPVYDGKFIEKSELICNVLGYIPYQNK